MNPESVVDRLDILCGNAADHSARRYVFCDDCSGSYDRAVTDSNARQDSHVRTDPDMIADLHRLGDAVLREQTETAYYALTLLRKLGSTYIDRGDGWFATKDGDTFKILVYNYRHYSNLYAMGEKFDMTFTERYTVFEPNQTLDVHLKLTGVENGALEADAILEMLEVRLITVKKITE